MLMKKVIRNTFIAVLSSGANLVFAQGGWESSLEAFMEREAYPTAARGSQPVGGLEPESISGQGRWKSSLDAFMEREGYPSGANGSHPEGRSEPESVGGRGQWKPSLDVFMEREGYPTAAKGSQSAGRSEPAPSRPGAVAPESMGGQSQWRSSLEAFMEREGYPTTASGGPRPAGRPGSALSSGRVVDRALIGGQGQWRSSLDAFTDRGGYSAVEKHSRPIGGADSRSSGASRVEPDPMDSRGEWKPSVDGFVGRGGYPTAPTPSPPVVGADGAVSERDSDSTPGEVRVSAGAAIDAEAHSAMDGPLQVDDAAEQKRLTGEAGSEPERVTMLAPTPEFLDIAPDDEYRIGSNDLLQIEVFQVEDLSGQERVNANGQITLPLVGAITVGGLTQAEAERAIADALAKDYLQDPQVDIYIEEFTSQRVTVMGQVDEPGVYPLKGATTLLQAIALAGGFDKLADPEEVVVFRSVSPGGVTGFVVDVTQIERGELDDPYVRNDDRVVVPKSGSREFIDTVANTLRGFIGFTTYQ